MQVTIEAIQCLESGESKLMNNENENDFRADNATIDLNGNRIIYVSYIEQTVGEIRGENSELRINATFHIKRLNMTGK